MKITSDASDEAILSELGGRLARMRLEKNLTQAQLADSAGVSKRTVERLERGDVAPQMSGFIRVCRALGVVERFEVLVPEPVTSPMAQLRSGGKRRRRASVAVGGAAEVQVAGGAPNAAEAGGDVLAAAGSGAGGKEGGPAQAEPAAPGAWTWGDGT